MDKLIITIEVNLPEPRTVADEQVIENHLKYIPGNCSAYRDKAGVTLTAEIISEIDLTEGG